MQLYEGRSYTLYKKHLFFLLIALKVCIGQNFKNMLRTCSVNSTVKPKMPECIHVFCI